MRKPTEEAVVYAWWRNAIKGNLAEEPSSFSEEPEAGFFKRRLVKGGPFVPARIWLYSPTDPETGDLCGDEVLQCEVDGQYRDPEQEWSWLCGNPITEAEFNHLTALRQWSEQHAPTEPYASPRQPVNWLAVPTPTFERKPTP